MAEQGFLIDQKTATDIGRVFTKVFGPNGSPAGDRIYNDNSIEIKHVRLLAVQDPLPSESADMVGYTAEVLKIDYATGTLVSTGITFDPDGDVEDYDIVKNYVYEVNSNRDLAGQIVSTTFKYVDDEVVSGVWVFNASVGGGAALVWANTGNDIPSDPLEFGASYDSPAGTATALEASDTFYIATPWNTKVIAPMKNFGYFVQDGTDWYRSIEEFAVKPSAPYPSGSGDGIEAFTCYMNKSDTSLEIGNNINFPSGVKVVLHGFDNVNAGASSLAVFNGNIYWASYDTAANTIYIIDKDTF